jgi:hypothetical protein
VEERPGVVPAPTAAEQDRPRMDPPNVLWFFGAFATGLGVYALIEAIPDSQDGLWRLVAAVAFLVGFGVAAAVLLRRRWWVPGGLAAALAVVTFPAVAVGFLQLLDVWPGDGPVDASAEFSGYSFGVALATAAIGVVAFALTRFPFILGVSLAVVVVASQLLVPLFHEGPSGDDRAVAALVVGAAFVIVGIFLDVFARRRDAFWFHVLGWLTVAAGLVWFTLDSSRDVDRGWAPMLILGVAVLVVAGPIRRATWAFYGVLGFHAALVHYLTTGLDDDRWPAAVLLLVVGLSIFGFGMLTHRYGKPWAERFVRRPPPTLGP